MNERSGAGGDKFTLKAVNVRGYYKTIRGYVKAVDGCSLATHEGDIIGLAGESGSGKSTLGKLLIGYNKPPLNLISGHVDIGNIKIYNLSWNERRKLWGSLVTMIPQYSMNSLNPVIKISDFIVDTIKQHSKEISKKDIIEKAIQRFDELQLSQSVLNMYPFELSGGMKQRVVIVASTLLNPSVIVADEPTSALDVSTQRALLELLYKIVKQKIVKSMVIISHDIATLYQISNYVYIMYAGKVVEASNTEELIGDPLHPYTKILINAVTTPEPTTRKQKLVSMSGAPPNLLNPPIGCRFYHRCPFAMEKCKSEEPPLWEIKPGRFVACWLYKNGVSYG
ncbi:MAG: ABC transporter ATP-binding protein [Thermoproteota archaeon]|jgi:peptide/nickel transport system ATP-binding protein